MADLQYVLRVLIVDDEADVRLLLRHALVRRHGVEVVGEAADGQEAIALAADLEPDLVVLDQMMPRLSGLDALPQIRSVAPQARVILHSSLSSAGLIGAAVAAGADCYIEKGRVEKLLAAIDRLFNTD